MALHFQMMSYHLEKQAPKIIDPLIKLERCLRKWFMEEKLDLHPEVFISGWLRVFEQQHGEEIDRPFHTDNKTSRKMAVMPQPPATTTLILQQLQN